MDILILLLGMFLMFLIYVYAENKLLLTQKHILDKGNTTGKCLKVVQISDVHKKRIASKIANRTKQLEPDVIFLTGDIISRHEKDFSQLELLASQLTAICPVFACIGNHEQDLSPELIEQYREIMKKHGIKLLENSVTDFEKDGFMMKIAGTSLRHGVYRNSEGGYSNLEKYTANDLLADIGEKEAFTILLAHNPLCFDAYCTWGANVVFSGHIHGGSVRLPLLGGLLSPERSFFPKYSKGVFKKGKTSMIVSGGIGKPRVFNPPEIVYCEINI